MYIDVRLFAKAEFLALFKTKFSTRRWAYIFSFTGLYWLMWIIVASGRALDHIFFPGFKRQPVHEPVFIVAPPRTGTTLTQKLMSLDEDRFVYNALYQTIFPALTFQRCFDAFVWMDRKIGQPFGLLIGRAERRWFGGWDEMHELRFNQPEEDDGFFVYTFLTEAIYLLFLHIDELWDAGFQDALPAQKRRKLMAFYRSCLQRRLYASGSDKTILSKATQSSGAVESLLEAFPDAKFITLVRDPCQSVASHVSVFWPVWQAHSPALVKDGRQSKAYARLAVRWFQHLFAFRKKVNPKQYYCIDYRELSRDPKATLKKLYRHFGWTMSETFQQRLTQANGRQCQFKSNHRYSLEEFGLSKEWIKEELRDLLDYYNLEDEMKSTSHTNVVRPQALPHTRKTPPAYVHQAERDKQKAIAYHSGTYFCPMEPLNGNEQRERDIAIARAQSYHLAAATGRTAEVPAEEEGKLAHQRHRQPGPPTQLRDRAELSRSNKQKSDCAHRFGSYFDRA